MRSRLRGQIKSSVLIAILALHAALLAYSASKQSPTANEPAHLVAGLTHLRTGHFALYRVNPPLVRIVAALPSWFVGVNGDFESYIEGPNARVEFETGAQFVTDNRTDVLDHFKWARWACIPFALLGGWICFAWASELFGGWSGLMALGLWCCSPMVLAHASLITPDAHAASLGLAACYTFWHWLKTPTWRQAALTGLILGFAELSKTTMILFYPLWPLLWIVYRWRNRDEMCILQWSNEAGMLILRMLIGLYVLNLGYLGEGSFTKLKDFRFTSELFAGELNSGVFSGNRFADGWLGEIPIPLPEQYVTGIDVQQRDFENFSFPS